MQGISTTSDEIAIAHLARAGVDDDNNDSWHLELVGGAHPGRHSRFYHNDEDVKDDKDMGSSWML